METDYGRIALDKAQELEGRLNTFQKKRAVRGGKGYVAAPYADLSVGSTALCGICGDTAATLFVKLTLRFDTDTDGELALCLDNLPVGVARIFGATGTSADTVIVAAPLLNGQAALSLKTDQNVTLLAVSIALSGEGCYVANTTDTFAYDETDTDGLLIYSQSGQITGCLFPPSAPDFSQPFVIGEGREADVAAFDDGGFAVLYRDRADNLMLCRAATDKTVSGYRCLGGYQGVFALGKHEEGFIVAQVLDGEVVLTALDDNFLVTAGGGKVGAPFSVSGVRFVKNTSPPVLVLFDGTRSYAKLPETSPPHMGETLTAVLSLTVEEA